jgi:hypothetical protein
VRRRSVSHVEECGMAQYGGPWLVVLAPRLALRKKTTEPGDGPS